MYISRTINSMFSCRQPQTAGAAISRFSMAKLRGSLGTRLSAAAEEPAAKPLTLAPKKISGLVQAAMARRM